MTTQLKADFMLLLVTLFWGVSYWLMAISLTVTDPFTLNALRFLIAFIAAILFAFNKLKGVNKITLKYGAILGSMLVLV
ncbi:MAG: DMT family permease, partial [bacterium]